MKARILESNEAIVPFGVPAAKLPVLNVPLAAHVAAECARAGLSLEAATAGETIVVIGADVFVNAATLLSLIELAEGTPGRLVLRSPGYARMAGGPESRPVDVAVVAENAIDSRAALRVIEVDAQETGFDLAEGPEALSVPAPRRVAIAIETWADLLFANLFAMTARVRNLSPWAGVGLVLLATARALSINKWRVAGKLVGKGRGCDIHPSAIVEASVLGNGVRIGPGAVVRGSILGDGVEVEDLGLVTGSVLGERARVQRQGMFRFSVAFPRANCGGGVQLSVFGEGASIRQGAYTIDRKLDGSAIVVAGRNGLVARGPSLGVAVGPGTSIGTGVWLAAGRAIPAGLTVVRSGEEVVAKIPAATDAGVYEVRGGTLVRRSG